MKITYFILTNHIAFICIFIYVLVIVKTADVKQKMCRPRGLMDKASDFGSEDCRFESCRGRTIDVVFIQHYLTVHTNA